MNIEIFETIPSTHLYLKDKILKGEVKPNTFVLAKSQSSAIGTNGRKWISPKEEAFALSFTIDKKELQDNRRLVFFIAFVIQKLIFTHCSIQTQVKWVNDIYLQGKKLAGILVEQVGNTFLVGIGLNLNQEKFFEEISKTAISLYQIDQKKRNMEDFLNLFIQIYQEEKIYWEKDNLYFWKDLSLHWLYIGKEVKIILPSEKVLFGTLDSIQQDGSLILNTLEGKKNIIAATLKAVE